MTLKRFIVNALEWVCGRLDAVPTVEFEGGQPRFYRYGGWGCRYGICLRGARLDERWGTGVWG